jgi:hypothetical protein
MVDLINLGKQMWMWTVCSFDFSNGARASTDALEAMTPRMTGKVKPVPLWIRPWWTQSASGAQRQYRTDSRSSENRS